jgi:hypothetical protein
MNKSEYEDVKNTLAEVNAELARNDLTDEQRKTLELHAAALAGVLLSIWLPMSNVRRAIMLVLFLIGLRAFVNHNDIYIVYWLLITSFSPRIMGELAASFGKFSRLMSKSK